MSEFFSAPFRYPWKEAPFLTKLFRLFYKRVKRTGAGVIIYYTFPKQNTKILLLHRLPPWNDWTFPKGGLEPGEKDVRLVAIREGIEETGLSFKIKKTLSINNYAFYNDEKRELVYRTVHYFLALAKNTDVDLKKNPDKKEATSIDKYKWVHIPEAIKLVKHENEKDTLRKAQEFLK